MYIMTCLNNYIYYCIFNMKVYLNYLSMYNGASYGQSSNGGVLNRSDHCIHRWYTCIYKSLFVE